MDHPCEKCGAAVEDGRPFCPHCRAPQIHVQIVDSELAAEGARDPSLGARAPSPPHALPTGRFDTLESNYRGLFDRGAAVRAALKAGVAGVLLGMVPVIGIVLTGSLAAYFYRREKGSVPAAGIGARLGGAAGVISFAANSLLIVIRIFALHEQQQYVETLLKVAQAIGYNSADPEIQAAIHNLFTPSGMALTFFFAMIFTVVLAAAGGALAVLVFRHPPRG